MKKTYYKGENVFLYIKFPNDAKNISNVKVKIAHDHNGEVITDLNWKPMQQMSLNEYFLNYKIPFDMSTGQYQVVYYGSINKRDAVMMESFHVIDKSFSDKNAIKIFGYINDDYTGEPCEDVQIKITHPETDLIMKSTSNRDGYWETYLYAGEYKFEFKLFEYEQVDIAAQINDDVEELQFNNIQMVNINKIHSNLGSFLVEEQYILKDGTPLQNLNVSIYSFEDPINAMTTVTTDNRGRWDCYLNEGGYLVKVNGKCFNKLIEKVFRLSIDNEGKYEFDDMSENIMLETEMTDNQDTEGKIKKVDYIKDRNGNGIVNVQVNIFPIDKSLDEDNIIEQAYTDPTGKWCLYLYPGKYKVEYYHPRFKPIVEEIEV